MSSKPDNTPSEKVHPAYAEQLREANEELLLAAVRQHELIEKLEIAEKKLSFLGLVVASSNESFVAVDFDGIITTWNPAAEELYGYKAAETVGHHLTMLTLPEDFVQLLKNIDKIKTGEVVRVFENIRITKGGESIDLEILMSPVTSAGGKVIGAATIARDITERIRASELREAYRLSEVERKTRELAMVRANETRLAESQMRVAIELSATQQLQEVSTQMIGTDDPNALYDKILDAAMQIMRAHFASIQMLYPERGTGGELWLMGHRGFTREAAKYWEWVTLDSEGACGEALRTGERVIVSNVEADKRMIGSEDRAVYIQTGIHAVQTTPLVSRTGRLLGMISTHWKRLHVPSDRDFRLLDVLARQAADLIERRQANKLLRESEQGIRFAMESAHMYSWEIDFETDKTVVSADASSVLGFARPISEIPVEQHVSTVIHPDDRARVREAIDQSKVTGEYHQEIRFVAPETGEIVWIEATGSVRRDDDGKPLILSGVTQNISVRKQAEIARRESEEKYRTLFDTIDQGYSTIEVIFDEGGKPVDYVFLEINPAFSELTGLKNAEGRAAYQLIPGLERLWVENYGKVVRTGEAVRFENYAEALNRWFDVFASRVGGEGSHKVALVFSNITERKLAEQEIKRLADRNREILESITEGYFTLDSEWRVTFLNPEAELILGREPGDLIGKVIWDEYPGTVGSEFEEAYRRTYNEKVVSTFTAYYPDHDVWYELNAYPAPDGITVYFRNVNLGARAEAALRESNEKFRTLADNIPQLAWMADAEGDIFWYNERWYEYTGTTFEEMQGLGWQKVHHPDEVDRVTAKFKEGLKSGDNVEDTFPIRAKNGEFRWFLTRAVPIRDSEGNIVRWFGTNTDITDQRRIEEDLRNLNREIEQQSRLFDTTINSISDFAYTFDRDARIVFINKPLLDLWGLTLEEATGKNFFELGYPEDLAERLEVEVQHVFDTKESVTGETPYTNPAGKYGYYEYIFSASLGKDGTVEFVTGSTRDITDRKRAEELLRRSSEELEFRVEERTAELAVTNENLKVESKERLLAEEERVRILHKLVTAQEDERRRIGRDLHDQLGQQVTALRLKLESMAVVAEGNEVYSEYVRKAQDYAKQIDTDVGFLTFELRPTILDDLGLVAAVENFVYEWSKNHGVPSDFHAAPAIPDRLAQEIEINLYRVVQEALNNVLKYAEAKTVTVQFDFRNSYLTLIVEDDGIGFDADNGTPANNAGNGLGLIGMRERCLLLGGTLEIESSPGSGTVIFARIPVKAASTGNDVIARTGA